MIRIPFPLAAAAFASMLLMASAVQAQTTTPRTTSPNTMQGTDGQRSEIARGDRQFLEDAAQGGHAEIEGSKLAEQKSKNADVKAFAAQMIKAHMEVRDQLTKLASSKGYTPPTEPSMRQKVELKALGAISGEEFDKLYSRRIGVAAHESALRMFKEASQRAEDPEIKAFAAKHVPDFEAHLKMARDLNKKVEND